MPKGHKIPQIDINGLSKLFATLGLPRFVLGWKSRPQRIRYAPPRSIFRCTSMKNLSATIWFYALLLAWGRNPLGARRNPVEARPLVGWFPSFRGPRL